MGVRYIDLAALPVVTAISVFEVLGSKRNACAGGGRITYRNPPTSGGAIYGCQAAAIGERKRADAGNACGNSDFSQIAAICERRRADVSQLAIFGNGYGCQAAAIYERIIADAGNALGNGDRGQATAVPERIIADAGKLTVFGKGYGL